MTKKEYAEYQAKVKKFFSNGLMNLSSIGEEAFFSKRPCECCERPLGGMREDCNGWNARTKEVEEYTVCEGCLYYATYGQLDDMTMMDMEKED